MRNLGGGQCGGTARSIDGQRSKGGPCETRWLLSGGRGRPRDLHRGSIRLCMECGGVGGIIASAAKPAAADIMAPGSATSRAAS